MDLLEALGRQAGARKRVPRADIWRAFREAHAGEAHADDARARLATRLTSLADEGRITLPAPRGPGWDRSARPPFPEWIGLVAPDRRRDPFDARAIPWAPELSFVLSLARVVHAEELLAVQAFLARGGRERPLVPARERSVQLFGDEKRLEQLQRTPLFGPGRLTLGILRCFPLSPPLALERGPAGSEARPVLVVENHHSWWSFCRWNERVGAYSGIAWGAGAAFGREQVAYLAQVAGQAGVDHVRYVGDLDGKGLSIPWRASQAASALGLRLEPEHRWYRRMLRRADEVALPTGDPIDAGDAACWLPDDLRDEVLRRFSAGQRVPQELVGTDELSQET